MDEDEIRAFWQEFDNEARQDAVDKLHDFILSEEARPLVVQLLTTSSSTMPAPAQEGLQNPICQPINASTQAEVPISTLGQLLTTSSSTMPAPAQEGLQNPICQPINATTQAEIPISILGQLLTASSLTMPAPAQEELQNPICQPINARTQAEVPISIPTPNSSGLQNQLYSIINPNKNVSIVQFPQVSTSASADIPNEDIIIINEERPPPIDLLPNSINEVYLEDDVVEVPPDSLGLLVEKLISTNEHRQAIKKCEDVLCQMRLKEEDGYPISQVLNILASVYIDLKYYDMALELLNKVLTIRQLKRGNDHLCVASVLNNMSVVHGKNGNYSEAYSLCRKSLDTKLIHLHKYHMEVAKQLNNLGQLDLSQGKYVAAAHYYQKALYIYECRLGFSNPRTLAIQAKIVYCHEKIGSKSIVKD